MQAASVVLDNDRSEVVIAPVVGGKVEEDKKIVLTVGGTVYEPQPRAHIRDVRTPGKKGNFKVNINDTFAMQTDENQRIVFQVVSINAIDETVVLLNTDTQEEFLLKKGTRIPKNAYVKRDGSNAGFDVMAEPEPDAPRRRPRSRRN